MTDGGEWHGENSDRCGESTRNREHKTERKNTHVPRRVSARLRLEGAPYVEPALRWHAGPCYQRLIAATLQPAPA